ncbi:hypothetical protein RYX36_037153, partial [Vicia faba]
ENQSKHSHYTVGSSSHSRQSAEVEHVEFDNTHFIGPLEQARFYNLVERQIWPEKIFTLNPQGDYRYFMDDMEKRKWGVLLNPPTELNFDIIREFYANAIPIEDVRYSYYSFVRGRVVSFDRNLVSQYLNHLVILQRGELCSYQKRVASKKWRFDLVSETLALTHNHGLFLNGFNQPVISNEIRRIAIRGHSHGNKAHVTLGFLALIMGLCRKEGVDIPNVATKLISSIVNEDYVLWYCVLKLAGEATPQPQAHAPPVGPTQYNEQQACVYNWKMMETQMRASFFLHDSMQLLYRHQFDNFEGTK